MEHSTLQKFVVPQPAKKLKRNFHYRVQTGSSQLDYSVLNLASYF
jgi:hypothetical protein